MAIKIKKIVDENRMISTSMNAEPIDEKKKPNPLLEKRIKRIKYSQNDSK